jgi:hypothetical protein
VTTTSTPRVWPAARRLTATIALGVFAASAVALGASGASVLPAKKPSPPPFSTLEKSLQAEEHLTFKVTYTTHGSGQSTTLVFEQRPPDARFGTSQGFVLELNGKTYYCGSTSGHPVCLTTSANPLLGLEGLFSPASVVTELKTLQTEIAAKIAGVKVSTSEKTFAGQASTCISVSVKSQGYEYCVTNAKGILAYGGSSTGYVEMTAYASSAPASDFALPKGATITSG